MTRVNVGIPPSELCDQMLLAEARELPRCLRYRSDHPDAPSMFVLGTGHVLWCAQYQASLIQRISALTSESAHRGFHLTVYPALMGTGRRWSDTDEARAVPLLRERIILRLREMRRVPRWTGREVPAWAEPVVHLAAS